MSNEFETLKHRLDKATPAPSSEARERALLLAMENFDEVHQGSKFEARLNDKQPTKAADITKGFFAMLQNLNSRQFYLGTASLAAIIVAVGVTQNLTSFLPLQSVSQEQIDHTVEADVSDSADLSLDEVQIAQQAPIAQEAPIAISPPVSRKAKSLPSQNRAKAVKRSGQAPSIVSSKIQSKARSSEAFVSSPDVSLVRPAPQPAPFTDARVDREQFPDSAPNPLKTVADAPVSTFSIDVDTASYSYMRSAIELGQLPDPQSVRVEELINYFDYAYKAPDSANVPFSTSVSVMETPWNTGTKLMQVGIKGFTPPAIDVPQHNLVFLIDTSGSMNQSNKLPLLVQSFRLLLSTLRPDDKVAIVTYAGSAGLALEPTAARESDKILASLKNLTAGGSTAGQAGLQQAYAIAEKMAADEGKARVILATDGDFNVGLSDVEKLKKYISEKRESGTHLSVLGFGRGNYNDALMQSLAQNGNGFAAYIDTLSEARKVLVDQVAGSLTSIANDVKIQVEFNPQTVSEYRLIGYETRALKREDFNNDKVDAGDIGAGHTVTAIYEVTPVGSKSQLVDPLRYGEKAESTKAKPAQSSDELAFVKLRYKLPGEAVSKLITTPVTRDRQDIPESEANFAAAVAGYGQILQGSDFLGEWSFKDAEALAQAGRSDDRFGYRSEFLSLLRLATSIKE
ncbi:MAG: VWA domain-containing protein [Hyphomicrobiales bacterium]